MEPFLIVLVVLLAFVLFSIGWLFGYFDGIEYERKEQKLIQLIEHKKRKKH